MTRKIWITMALVFAVVLGAGIGHEVVSGQGSSSVPCSKGWEFSEDVGACLETPQRTAERISAATVACDATHIYPGCTVSLNGPRWTNTGQALSQSSTARSVLCATTISGAKYVSTGYPTPSRWRTAIDGLFGANFLTQEAQDQAWLSVHDTLFATTVSGSKYCASKAKYAGGKWDQAFSTIATLETYLRQNPLVTQLPPPTVSGTVTTG